MNYTNVAYRRTFTNHTSVTKTLKRHGQVGLK